MLDIVGSAVAEPALALSHHGRELKSVQLRVATVVGKCPGDIAAAEVVALKGQGDPVYILWAVRPGLGQAGRQILNPHSNGILRVGNIAGRILVFKAHSEACIGSLPWPTFSCIITAMISSMYSGMPCSAA